MTTKSLDLDYKDFMTSCEAECAANGDVAQTYFLKTACRILEEAQNYDGLSDVIPAALIESNSQGNHVTMISGYACSELGDRLTLILCDYCKDSQNLQNLIKTDSDKLFKRLERLYTSARQGKLDNIDPGYPVFSLVRILSSTLPVKSREFNVKEGTVNLLLVTNKLSKITPPESKQLTDGTTLTYQIADFSLLNDAKPRPLVINIAEMGGEECGEGLPFLQVNKDNGVDFYEAYLLVVPAEVIVRSYDIFHTRLLERNVRVYLQKRGKVNRSMHDTIAKDPQSFFVYNNGLALTAESLEFSEDCTRITKIHGLQVVNGGQTMACLHQAWKEKKNISQISVQAKLTVVPSLITEVIVPYISRFSNSQNAVKDIDQHSNDIVQRIVEGHSRKVKTSGTMPTSWYYERMRGQYDNAQLHLTPSEKKTFAVKNPKSQLLQPTTLAKATMTYEMMPHLVARGAQKAYTGNGSLKGYCDYMAMLFAVNPGYISCEDWFRISVAQVILVRDARVIAKEYIKKEYPLLSSFIAHIVTYAISSFVFVLRESGQSLNLIKLWNLQHIDNDTEYNLRLLVRLVSKEVSKRPDHSEWLKQVSTWEYFKEKLRNADLELRTMNSMYTDSPPTLIQDMVNTDIADEASLSFDQRKVLSYRSDSYWQELDTWLESQGSRLKVDTQTRKALKKRLLRQVPTDRQSSCLLKLETNAIKVGWNRPYIPEQAVLSSLDKCKLQNGNPVTVFLESRNYNVLVLDRTCDLSSGSIFVDELFKKCSALTHEEEMLFSEKRPELGSIATFKLSNNSVVVFAYARKTAQSTLNFYVLEACMKEIAKQFTQDHDNIILTHFGYEDDVPENKLKTSDIKNTVTRELYAFQTKIVSPCITKR